MNASPVDVEAAPLSRRAFSFLIDAMMQAVLLGVMAAIFSDLRFSERAIVAGLLLVSSGYSIGFIGMTSSTPGKMAMGMWVSDGAGKRVLPDRAILRYLVIALPNLVLLGVLRDEVRLSIVAWLAVTGAVLLINAALVLRGANNRLLHDRIAGTTVIVGRPPELDT
jgi:uncharacterized RDD family membrane protein YckC